MSRKKLTLKAQAAVEKGREATFMSLDLATGGALGRAVTSASYKRRGMSKFGRVSCAGGVASPTHTGPRRAPPSLLFEGAPLVDDPVVAVPTLKRRGAVKPNKAA